MTKAKRSWRLAVSGAVLGAVCLGVAAAAAADSELLWKRQLGSETGDVATGVAIDAAGNAYLTGFTVGSLGGPTRGSYDAWAAKYDPAGHLLWKRQLGTESTDEAYGVATDAAGNVYLTGVTFGSLGRGIGNVWLAKYDAAGHVLWKRQFGFRGFYAYEYVSGLATDAAGNVYLTGSSYDRSGHPSSADLWVVKWDAYGNLLWERKWGTEFEDLAYDVALDSAGNYYVTWVTNVPDKWAGKWVAKFDPASRLLWKRRLAPDDEIRALATDAAGNVYLTGYTPPSFGNPTRGGNDALVAKYDAAGHFLWKRQLGTDDTDEAHGVATDAAGNVYLTGFTQGSLGGPTRGSYDAWAAKYDPAGHLLWKRQLGTESTDEAYGVATDATGNVYLTGYTGGSLGGPSRGNTDAWVAKYSAD